ncbi:MAG: hypothetical protein HOO99_06050 [Hyphomicrobiaceae bacterium]|nr:hypothetical protein [Hyphomicrobiaceae bacterium]
MIRRSIQSSCLRMPLAATASVAVLAALILPISLARADVAMHRGLAQCANQDLKLESVLSDSILSQELPAQRYVVAAEWRMAARRACGDGRYTDAMEQFERAAKEIGLHLGNADPGMD